MMRISDLRNKDVISGGDGKKLGFIRDIEINVDRGCIDALVIPGESRFFSLFGKGEELVITWERIRKIGVDVILVEPDRITPRGQGSTDQQAHNPTQQKTAAPIYGAAAAVNPADEDLDFFTF